MKGRGRIPAAAPLAVRKPVQKAPANPLFEKRPRDFRIGRDILPYGTDVTRYVKWPKYVRIQRQRKVLLQRLKVPPAINQFRLAMDASSSNTLFRLMSKYKPESKLQKAERLTAMSSQKNLTGELPGGKKPINLKFGINHVVELVESKKATLVVIAHDVEPIELVVWLPALCHKMGIPYCIVKSKARLGTFVHQKNVTAVAFTNVRPEDKAEFTKLSESCRTQFNDRYNEVRKRWGGGIMGSKSQHKTAKRERVIAREEAKRVA